MNPLNRFYLFKSESYSRPRASIVKTLQAEEEAEHNRTVALVAGSKFSYPNDEHPDWTTYVNVPEHTTGIQHESELVYPDVVVVSSNMEIVRVAEVESKMVVDAEDVRRWKVYASLCQAFYLYVPIDARARVLQVLNFNRIPCKMLGLYAYDSQGRLLVDND